MALRHRGPVPPVDDAELVAAALAGAPDAFGELYLRWFDPVYDVARRIVRDPQTAAEVAQDVFLHGWRALGELRDPAAAGGWLLRSARNRALNRLERERRSVAVDPQESTAEEDRSGSPAPWDRLAVAGDPTDAMADAEVAELVWQSADALGARDLSLLDLHLRHHLSPAEIAEELGVAPNAAHQMLFRLRNRLGLAVRARVLWRDGHPRCDELGDVLATAGVSAFGAEAVKRITAHVELCGDCQGRQKTRLAPAVLFASGTAAAAPVSVVVQVAEDLEADGVPMGGVVRDVAGRSSPTASRRGVKVVAAAAALAFVSGGLWATGGEVGGDRGEVLAVGEATRSPVDDDPGARGAGPRDPLGPGTAAPDAGGVPPAPTTTLAEVTGSGREVPEDPGSSATGVTGPSSTTVLPAAPTGGSSSAGGVGGGGAGGSSGDVAGGGASGGGSSEGGAAPPAEPVADPPYVKTVDVSAKYCTKGSSVVVAVTYGAPAGAAVLEGTWSLSGGTGAEALVLTDGAGSFALPLDATGQKVYVDVTVTDGLGQVASGSGVAYC
jgi:RNA polymerase sigma factor (sigma-70 family)